MRKDMWGGPGGFTRHAEEAGCCTGGLAWIQGGNSTERSHMRLLLVLCHLSAAGSGISWGTSDSSPAVFARCLQLVSQQNCTSDTKLGKATNIVGAGALTHEGLHGPWG